MKKGRAGAKKIPDGVAEVARAAQLPPVAGDKSNRPDWARPDRSTRIWSEDDATTSLPDHEGVAAAHERLRGMAIPRPLETWDDGESVYKLLPGGIVVVDSYPGNSEIRSLLPAGGPDGEIDTQDAEECRRGFGKVGKNEG